jgi:perosamine synthetase
MKEKRQKVIITGGTGLLASNIALYKRDDWEILLLTRNHTLTFEGVSTSKANLLDSAATERLFESFKPDLVIHTAGLTNVEECEKNYYSAFLANSVVAKNIALLCAKLKVKLVHISTDHFSKEDLEYSTENDIGLPLNNYAETKFLGESQVSKICPDALIVRTNFFGWGHKSRVSFSDFIIDNLRKGIQTTLFNDVIFTPIFIDDLIDSISELAAQNKSGIFNVVSNKKLTKYEFGVKIAEVFALDKNLIQNGSIKSKNMTVRPTNMALSSDKLVKALGEKFSFDITSSLMKLKDVEFEGRRKKLIASFDDRAARSQEQIFYGKQHIDENDVNSVISTLLSSHLTQGPKVEEFEEKVANYVGSKYAVSFANLTCGLHAAYLAADLKSGDYIITSPLTFVATSNAALYCNATPLFADIDPVTLNIDVKKVEELILKFKGKIKLIAPVHFGGHPCDMRALGELSKKYNIPLIEDAAHAIGGDYVTGGKIGNGEHSLITGFSFHPVKSVTTGEGAILTTNDSETYKKLCRIRSHGITKGNDPFINKDLAFTKGEQNSWYYEMQTLGYNYRLTDIQAALGVSQMSKIEYFMKRRREVAAVYDSQLSELKNVKVVQRATRNISGNHLYVTKVDFKAIGITRHELYTKFKDQGVHLHVHYIPVYMQPIYEEVVKGSTPELTFTNTSQYYEQAVTLPLHPDLTDKNVALIMDLFKKYVG